ncbi:hypothetical protein AB0O64_38025, partial [Streptomyces sp. NPDC088341]
MTSPTATADFPTARNGFPVESCRRCRGMGRLPEFSHTMNGVCRACGGSGYDYPAGKPKKLYGEWADHLAEAAVVMMGTWHQVAADNTRAVTTPVRVGDIVRRDKSEPWRTVTAVRVTRRVTGWGLGEREFRSMKLETVVTFDDGTTYRGWGEQWQRQLTAD